ncbi:MAG: hypothetical protein KatS3mg061_0030 [Dehalococcoidia bacterium]|nr:MAG: hypothetical protein KatS3mg061_0030 [Dehalococcoidia bacterium]
MGTPLRYSEHGCRKKSVAENHRSTENALEEEAIAYALGALEPPEMEHFRQRLERDPDSRQALAAALADLDLLAETVEPVPAPPGLRSRILAAARAEQPPQPVVLAWYRRPALWAAAAAAAIILALTGWNLSLQHELALRERILRTLAASERVVTLVPSEGSTTAGAVLMPSRQDLPVLVPGSLPPLGQEQVYQVWIVRSSQPRSAGIFRDPSQPVLLSERVQPGDTIAITIEPGPRGSPLPTSAPIASAQA